MNWKKLDGLEVGWIGSPINSRKTLKGELFGRRPLTEAQTRNGTTRRSGSREKGGEREGVKQRKDQTRWGLRQRPLSLLKQLLSMLAGRRRRKHRIQAFLSRSFFPYRRDLVASRLVVSMCQTELV